MIDDFIACVEREASAKAARRALQAGRPSSSAAPPESSAGRLSRRCLGLKAGRRTACTPPPVPATSPAKSPRVAGSTESPLISCRMIQMPAQKAKSRGSEQPKTPRKGSRPPPKLPSDSAAWKPSVRGGETADRSESAQRLSPRLRRAERSPGLTLPRRRRASRPSEPISFAGRSKDRRDYRTTSLDQIHDQGIELFLAGATKRPYCSLELLLRDAKRRAGQVVVVRVNGRR